LTDASSPQAPPSSRWIREFRDQLVRGRHVVLCGNVHDRFLCDGRYLTVQEFLQEYFLDTLHFEIVAHYDTVDGFRFARPEMSERFTSLCRARVMAAPTPGPGTPGAPLPGQAASDPGQPAPPPGPAGSPPRGRPLRDQGNAAVGAPGNLRMASDEAAGNIRVAMAQSEASVAVVMDLADLLTSSAEQYNAEERQFLALLKKCTLEASILERGPAAGYRNTLVVTASDLKRVPLWFHHENPYVAIVTAGRPSKEERRYFAEAYLGTSFFEGQQVPQGQLPALAGEFADLTEGFQCWDLEALRRTSHVERLCAARLRPLVDFYKFGMKDDPWQKLDRNRVTEASELLSRRVLGQPAAVERVVDMLTSAQVGVTMSPGGARGGRPKGVFFFVGPTGVGKTELAKALTELVFGDDKAFARFDMSEYKEEHAAEKLAGAPPGFVGYDEGGQLTNRVMERPHSILLFDEIEKAHPKVLDKFLQILEDGRLTDGKGQTAYFHQTAIIFTSNLGASDLSDPTSGAVIRPGIMGRMDLDRVADYPYQEVQAHFQREVEWFFTSRIGRAELLNRLGDNIVVFDLLRPEFVRGIAEKFLRLLTECAREARGLDLRFSPEVPQRVEDWMRQGDNLLFGGRRVKSLLETMVERPLNRWLFQQGEPESLRGARLDVTVAPDSRLEVTRA
jgi:ATP-dependent Clp protease ATP-binding subunit ClpA